ncbi:MAG: LytR C-terminal domain-containing protein [Acidimicrobiales bacterium]
MAVILGIVLLQQFDSDIDTGGGSVAASSIPEDTTSTTRRVGLTTVPVVTTTTVRARAKADVKVVVANGAGERGLGATTTNTLKTAGYTTLAPTDATTGVDKTNVQFADGYEADAREVAAALTLPATVVTRLAASPPIAAADIGDAKVIVILGVDIVTSRTSTTAVGGVATTTTSTIRRP